MPNTCAAVVEELEKAGTAQNIKVYTRHGVPADRMFGVSFANINKLAKRIKTDHELALDLWETDLLEPRIVACMVADAEQFSQREFDTWARDLDSYVIADQFAALVARSPHARKLSQKWAKSKQDHIGQAGWNLIGMLASRDVTEIPDDFFTPYLAEVATTIHKRSNRTRHAMNMALCAIGIARPKLRSECVRIGKMIGDVEVDHGETSCKTPNAVDYIARAIQRQAGGGRKPKRKESSAPKKQKRPRPKTKATKRVST